jgi:hypothetical protein
VYINVCIYMYLYRFDLKGSLAAIGKWVDDMDSEDEEEEVDKDKDNVGFIYLYLYLNVSIHKYICLHKSCFCKCKCIYMIWILRTMTKREGRKKIQG